MILFFSNDNQFRNKENFTNLIETESFRDNENKVKKYKCIPPGKSNIVKTFNKIKDNLDKRIPQDDIHNDFSNDTSKSKKNNNFFSWIKKIFWYIKNIVLIVCSYVEISIALIDALIDALFETVFKDVFYIHFSS